MESEHEKILKAQVNRVNPLMVQNVNDFKHGSRKCFNSARTSRKVHKCRNSLCIWFFCIGDVFRAIQYDDADIMFEAVQRAVSVRQELQDFSH